MKIKNQMKNNNKMKIQQKPPWRFSQAKYHHWEFLNFKKNDYRSVINITFISNIVFYLMVISTFNKG